MAYDEGLAQRIREHFQDRVGLSEKRMFGGLCFMLSGHMCCGIVGDSLMVRVGPEQYTGCLQQPHAREMDFTGKPMKGLLFIDPPGFEADAELACWLNRAAGFITSLPSKAPPDSHG